MFLPAASSWSKNVSSFRYESCCVSSSSNSVQPAGIGGSTPATKSAPRKRAKRQIPRQCFASSNQRVGDNALHLSLIPLLQVFRQKRQRDRTQILRELFPAPR